MDTRKALGALTVLALMAPTSAFAASLTSEASGGIILAQGLDTSMDIGIDARVDDSATGTPSEDSAGDDSSFGSGLEFMTSSSVSTDDDLVRYQTSLQGSDSYFAEADFSSESRYDVAYYHDGRLFGFIPVQLKSYTHVMTNEEGQVVVKTDMPWWHMFVTGTGDVAASVDERLATSGTVANDMKLGGSAAAKARILEAVAEAHAQARVSASAQ